MTSKDPHYFHKEFPKTRPETDFWGQVKRSVNGQSVSEEQIEQIVLAIQNQLRLLKHDVLLDLGCANGALTDRLFARCQGGTGVDFSEYLIGIAQKYFQKLPERAYCMSDAVDFVRSTQDTGRFTKALCYGVFQYLPSDRAYELLSIVSDRLPTISDLFLGNLPDKSKLGDFFRERDYVPGIEDDPHSAIGIWRTEDEISKLAYDCGWQVTCSHMPKEFFSAHYRFDALLRRRA